MSKKSVNTKKIISSKNSSKKVVKVKSKKTCDEDVKKRKKIIVDKKKKIVKINVKSKSDSHSEDETQDKMKSESEDQENQQEQQDNQEDEKEEDDKEEEKEEKEENEDNKEEKEDEDDKEEDEEGDEIVKLPKMESEDDDKIEKKTSINKKTMYLNDDKTKPITAAGALFYKKDGASLSLLIVDSNGKYEDIGGKIDSTDKTVYQAASREIEEETNGLIKAKDVIDRLKKAEYIYVPHSKYVIFLISAVKKEQELKKEDFGDYEGHDKILRSIGWVKRENLCKAEVIKHKLNWRLKIESKKLFARLAEIEKTLKFKKRLFKKN